MKKITPESQVLRPDLNDSDVIGQGTICPACHDSLGQDHFFRGSIWGQYIHYKDAQLDIVGLNLTP